MIKLQADYLRLRLCGRTTTTTIFFIVCLFKTSKTTEVYVINSNVKQLLCYYSIPIEKLLLSTQYVVDNNIFNRRKYKG
jgi:hypothetical protein